MNGQDITLITTLQDEICNDVLMTIASCALDDDDGVATVAFESLGRMVLDVEDDDFHREVRFILGQISPGCFRNISNANFWDNRQSNSMAGNEEKTE